MRIQHNISALNSYNRLNTNNTALSKNLEKLSSGYKINRAGDDAAGLAISEKMRSQIKGLEAAQKNASDAIGLIQTAEGALTEVHSMLNRMVYLATQSANGTYEQTERDNLQLEVEELISEIDRIGKQTKFSQITLLDGSFSQGFQVGPSSAERISVTIADMSAKGAGVDVSGGDAVQIDAINRFIDQVSTARAELGAKQNRLEHTLNNLATTHENISAAESRIRDTDMADEMTAYTKNNILVQAAQAMLAQANTVPQGVLQLLQ